jgi:hypothetical protein
MTPAELQVVPREEPAESSSAKLMGIIEHMGKNPHVQVETLKELLTLKVSFEREEARKDFHAAMAEFNRNIPVILKNKHVRYVKKDGSVVDYWHESLDSVVDAITGALAAVGISKNWPLVQDGAKITVSCVLTHASGHSETRATLSASPDDSGNKNSIQAIKSTITYLERTTLLAATGTAPKDLVHDDDGRAAGADAGPHLEEARLVECTEWIKDAEDSSKLAEAFTAACSVAKDAEDKFAPSVFVKAMLNKAIPWIKGSADRRTLQIVFHRAYALAESVDDKDAMGQLRREADARKRELGGGAQ